jgi:hypothetical protein
MSTLTIRRVAVFLTLTAAMSLLPTAAGATVASVPTALAATAGNTQVALAWTAPADTGGGDAPISDYIVEYSSDSGVTYSRFFDAVGNGLTATVTGLTNGTSYAFRVSAVNGAGTGAVSVAATATPFVVHTANDPATFSACPPGIAPAAGFTDTTATDVDCVKYYGITTGTTAATYSPFNTVTRLEMALFLTRMATVSGVTLGSGVDQGFSDIINEPAGFQTAINQIKQLGITVGKTATTYAPADNVTREEMALFVSRFLAKATVGPGGNTELGSGASSYLVIKSNDTDHNFTDLTGLVLWESQTSIINLWNLGVTDVQAVTTFEPSGEMTRGAMATFITNALAHTNARPAGLNLQASTYRAQGTPLVTFSATNRTALFEPIAGTRVDTFKFTHTVATTPVRFDAAGKCSGTQAAGVGTTGTTKCTIDSEDPITDAFGNLVTFQDVLPAVNKQDFWAWAATSGTVYDNDDHATGASKITVETYQ